jgi:hypothetical protein
MGSWRVWLQGALLALPGCKTAERVSYRHEPTAALYERYDLQDPAVAPFTVDGVVVSPFFVPLDYETTAVKVSFLAARTARAEVVGGALRGASERPFTEVGEAPVDKPVNPATPGVGAGVLQGYLTVLTLPTAELEAMSPGFTAEVTVRIDGGTPQTLSFPVQRDVERLVISR